MSEAKACGPDGISAYHLRRIPPETLQEVIQDWITNREIPQESNASEIVPIHKAGDTSNPGNYRPIALINTVIKLYELTILRNIENRL